MTKVGLTRDQFEIRLSIDKERRLLTVSDNGIGMDEADLENNLGVIASGSPSSSARSWRGRRAPNRHHRPVRRGLLLRLPWWPIRSPSLPKKYGSDQAYRWQSDGVDGYTIEPCEKDAVGTDVIMHIKPDTEEDKDEYSQYLREYPSISW